MGQSRSTEERAGAKGKGRTILVYPTLGDSQLARAGTLKDVSS